jgi:hypothetical protein
VSATTQTQQPTESAATTPPTVPPKPGAPEESVTPAAPAQRAPPTRSAALTPPEASEATITSPSAPTPSQAPVPEVSPSTSPTPAAPSVDLRYVARELQAALRRIGCYGGGVDGSWGASSSDALRRFNQYAGTDLNIEMASTEAVDTVHTRTGRVCPLICPRGQVPAGDHCVGVRQPRPPVQREAPPSYASPPVSASVSSPALPPKGRRCLDVLGSTYCE